MNETNGVSGADAEASYPQPETGDRGDLFGAGVRAGLEALAGRALDGVDLAAEVVRLRAALSDVLDAAPIGRVGVSGTFSCRHCAVSNRDGVGVLHAPDCPWLVARRVLDGPFPAPPLRKALVAAGFHRVDPDGPEWPANTSTRWELWHGGENWQGVPFELVLPVEEGTAMWREYEVKARRFLRAMAGEG